VGRALSRHGRVPAEFEGARRGPRGDDGANERRDDKRCRAQRHSGAARRRHRLPRRACRSPARWRIRRPRSAPPP
jgi:hypothetical protein